MLGDLGCVLEADPRARGLAAHVAQTLWWRAPEVLFGSRFADQAMDLWSFGLVLAEIGGFRFQTAFHKHVVSEVGYALALCQQLGTPDDPELTAWQDWWREPPKFRRRPWPAPLVLSLAAPGLDLLEKLLIWAPSRRMQATAVLDQAFLAPERFALADGKAFFQGQRHPWNLLAGSMAVEVLEWLRADEALVPGSPEFAALAVSFDAARNDAKSEQGRKFIMAGAMADTIRTKSMCGLSLSRLLPLPRLRAWRKALMAVNAEAFAAMEASARASLKRLSPEGRGKNGDEFLNLDLSNWFAICGELTFVEPGGQDTGFWAEPAHQDGGASILHLGLTLYGRRALACQQGFGLEDVTVANAPGTVYMGQLTGPVHQVSHQEALESELLEVPGLGRVAVAIMLRTGLFGFFPLPQPRHHALPARML